MSRPTVGRTRAPVQNTESSVPCISLPWPDSSFPTSARIAFSSALRSWAASGVASVSKERDRKHSVQHRRPLSVRFDSAKRSRGGRPAGCYTPDTLVSCGKFQTRPRSGVGPGVSTPRGLLRFASDAASAGRIADVCARTDGPLLDSGDADVYATSFKGVDKRAVDRHRSGHSTNRWPAMSEPSVRHGQAEGESNGEPTAPTVEPARPMAAAAGA